MSSCLKDTPYIDVSNSQPIIEFGLSPANGVTGPFAYVPDSVGGPSANIDTAVAVVVASPQVLSSTVTVTVKVDTSQISAYNTANGTSFTVLPSNLYTLKTTATVNPGYRVGRLDVVLNMSQFPAHHSYALPLAIVSASTNTGQNLIVSGNSATYMWLFSR
ncbi:hypothetical protein GCM10011511_44600 [Puia dinghuensis]|uniref:BT-3987-like N-terminal domain-containing protein n=2 Tax=Puia dinghuensis TaxID=1792502 RepID=A0A8J2XV40_9BACT|nr:hypothetical protein GCM10011511_44600 [Puia dinghuensis]